MGLLAIGGYYDGFYKFLLLCHILTAIVGLGAVTLNALYAAQGRQRPGPPGRAIAEANYAVTRVAEWFIYATFVFGILLVVLSDGVIEFSDTWITLSFLVYFAALGVSHAVLLPNTKKILALLREMEQGPPPAGGPPPQVARLEALGKQQAMAGMVQHVLLIVIVALMIWRP